MHSKRLRVLVLLVVLGLVAAACGSDRKSDSSSSTTAGGGATTTAAPAGKTFGTLASPCGPGDAKTATQQGVTATSISIGYGDDAGYAASPGLSHQISDAIKALTKWCNEQGGINGRKIDAKYYDAKIFEVNNVMLDACKNVFMLVGEGWAGDAGQEETRLGCKMAAMPTYTVSAAFAHGRDTVVAVPNPADQTPAAGLDQLAKLYPDAVKKAGVLTAAKFAATDETVAKVLQASKPYGWDFTACGTVTYNLGGEDDWTPIAQKLKDCGAQMIYFAGSIAPNFQNYLAAASKIGFKPYYYVDANFYDEALSKWNTNGFADKVIARNAFLPFEEASSNPATKQYLDLVKGNGGDVNLLGAQATSAFLLWATAAKACGDKLTSDCVITEGKKITKWTAGGLHVPLEPGKNQAPDCGLLVALTGGAWKRLVPTEAGKFDCDPKYTASVQTAALAAAKLDANRISQQFVK